MCLLENSNLILSLPAGRF